MGEKQLEEETQKLDTELSEINQNIQKIRTMKSFQRLSGEKFEFKDLEQIKDFI